MPIREWNKEEYLEMLGHDDREWFEEAPELTDEDEAALDRAWRQVAGGKWRGGDLRNDV